MKIAVYEVALLVFAFVAPGGRAQDGNSSLTLAEVDSRMARGAIRAIDTGVPTFNSGDAAGCYRIYQGALLAMQPILAYRPDLQGQVKAALAQAETEQAADGAWTLRGTIDRINALAPQGAAAVSLREIDSRIVQGVTGAIGAGAPKFNNNDAVACYRIYQGALCAIQPLLTHRGELQEEVTAALEQAQAQRMVDAAWTLRRVLSQINESLDPVTGMPPDRERDPGEIFAELLRTLAEIKNASEGAGEDGRNLLAPCSESRDSAELLRSKLGPGVNVPKPYARSLEWDLQLARLVLRTESQAQKLEDMKAVADDLGVKKASAQNDNPFRLIRVVAKTLDGDQEIRGLVVYYVSEGWYNHKPIRHIKTFRKLSSPTFAEIAPGEYRMWTERGGFKSSVKETTLSRDGGAEQEIELPVASGG